MGFPNNWYYGNYLTQIRPLVFKFYNPNSPQYVEKIMDGHNNLKFEWHNRNLNSEDMSKYIHNLMKEKLDRVSVRLVD